MFGPIRKMNPSASPGRRLLLSALLLCLLCQQNIDAQTAAARASISIDARKTLGEISPLLYGQFLEFMFEGVKGGVYAELLRDRSFEEAPNAIGLPRNWERYPDDRNDDYGLNFLWDSSEHYPTKPDADQSQQHALRVVAGDGVIPRHGVFQNQIPLRQGVEYRGYLWLKTAGYDGRIRVALENAVLGGPVYDEAIIRPSGTDWRLYDFLLRPRQDDPVSRFAVLFEGPGRIWLDQVSLIPGDAIDGVRQDVFQKIKNLNPAFIRWPGGNVAQDYHWRWGVGPRDERTTWINLSWKNELEPADFGTDEFIRFARAVGAEPSLTVNVEGRGATAEEAAGWVEYCNGPPTSKYGAKRAANGRSAPYNVKLWELGNEIWGSWVRGHSSAETYARNLNRYAAAMRAVDPSIKIIAVGDNEVNWNRTILRAAAANIDYLAIHHYYGRKEIAGNRSNLMARPLHYERFYKEIRKLLSELTPQRSISLAINEWGLDLPIQQQYSMESALYGARLLNVFERTDGLVALSAVSDLVNGWPGGIIQASRHGLFVSPLYLVNQLYSERLGQRRLAAEVISPTFDSSSEGIRVPTLDVAASRLGERISIKAVNTDQSRELVTRITFSGTGISPLGELATINASSAEVANSFGTPEAIKITRNQITASTNFEVTLPRQSVSVLTVTMTRSTETD